MSRKRKLSQVSTTTTTTTDMIPPLRIPEHLLLTLKPHQIIGAQFLWKNIIKKKGCVLADSMGLGKTVQVIAALCGAFGCGTTIVPRAEPSSSESSSSKSSSSSSSSSSSGQRSSTKRSPVGNSRQSRSTKF